MLLSVDYAMRAALILLSCFSGGFVSCPPRGSRVRPRAAASGYPSAALAGLGCALGPVCRRGRFAVACPPRSLVDEAAAMSRGRRPDVVRPARRTRDAPRVFPDSLRARPPAVLARR